MSTKKVAPSRSSPDFCIPVCVRTTSHFLECADVGLGVPTELFEWQCELTHADGERSALLAQLFESVTFSLHPSFLEPVRTLVSLPYCVTEKGWGEFPIGVEIRLRESLFGKDIVLRLSHELKLRPPGKQPAASKEQAPFVRETYDELALFDVDPSIGYDLGQCEAISSESRAQYLRTRLSWSDEAKVVEYRNKLLALNTKLVKHFNTSLQQLSIKKEGLSSADYDMK